MVLTSLASSAAYTQKYNSVANEKSEKEASEELRPVFNAVVVISLLELALFIYAIYLAIQCNEEDKLIHFIAAVFFPLGYIAYAKLYKRC